MRDEKKRKKQRAIEIAAYALLEEKGYQGCSMLAIARKAKASNETLYNWYGDKRGLFSTLVANNAQDLKQLLEAPIEKSAGGLETLRLVSPVLLDLLVSERAVALNRAAAADHSGELGRALSQAGRETILPLLEKVFINAKARHEITFDSPHNALDLYMGLLVGDWQIRRVATGMKEPNQSEIDTRAKVAIDRFLQLTQPTKNATD